MRSWQRPTSLTLRGQAVVHFVSMQIGSMQALPAHRPPIDRETWPVNADRQVRVHLCLLMQTGRRIPQLGPAKRQG